MKWLVIFVLLGVFSQAVTATGFTVSVFSVTSKTAILRWSRYSGASSYKVSAALQSSPGQPIAFAHFGANTVMGSINSLSQNTNYIFTVEALGSSQEILSSTTTGVSSTAPEMMDALQNAEPKDSTTVTAEFTLDSNAINYVIRVLSSDGFYREDTVSSSPAQIQSLSPYTEYTLSIMAVNSGGRSQPSPTVTAKTVLSPPQLSTSSPSNDSITISWAPVAHAVLYSVSTFQFGSNTSMQYNTSSTYMTIFGLDAGSLYSIQGYAWDPEGRKGDLSLEVNQTTRPPTPSSVSVSMVTSNNVTELSVSWAIDPDVYGSVDYFVTSNHNLSCNSTSSPCSLSPVSCGEVHTIQVTASNEAGPSYPSDPEVFVTFPCPPESLTHHVEDTEENCTLTWDTVTHADGYKAFIKRGDGIEEICNTTSNNCTYHCQCGYMYLLSVVAFNQAGNSPAGENLNYTTLPCCPEDLTVSVVSTDTLEITWTAARGADMYQTRAVDNSEVILCNDTAPECALSDLTCDSPYSVVVIPCNDYSGCNHACQAHTKDTAPCMPTNMGLTENNSTCVTVSWTSTNRAANYTVSALGEDGSTLTCTTTGTSCDVTDLPCGSTFEVTVTADSDAGQSLPSYSESLETEPCCPENLTVVQVTQAMSNVSWSHAKGAQFFLTSLTSARGHARCHTQDSHCIMGCVTCGTSYTVAVEAQSHSGRVSNCAYEGFSSSACCPSGIRLYKMADNSLQVHWRSSSSSHSHSVEMAGSNNNYTCTAAPGEHKCNVANALCGDTYHVVVAPLTADGSKGIFCSARVFSVTCSNSNIGAVIYRGKRSVD
ncbi:hypothetical protein JOB18_023639 [Solea senegalensis]|uniref:Fibronectin type III domain-containing protein 7-like n=2 Tax=Solea senegalensis TaxID=28829 RepID=A0AAV6S8E4_SOLSE|nr:fibronectin type III domain-containing protein 7-like [Solea senegalensis]KAG7514046.1 fibronectin type III domain-containing protein 7-like [Solea senegalensis]KAG7514047.1 hypothetical protein JOB18_023639 [Solea senegalensis]